MNQAMKANIRAAYAQLERASGGSVESSRLLHAAYTCALEGERKHRKVGAGLSRYDGSASLAAEYFVVKWFVLADPLESKTADHWASLRSDAMFAAALKSTLHQTGKVPDLSSYRIEEIDYFEHFVRNA